MRTCHFALSTLLSLSLLSGVFAENKPGRLTGADFLSENVGYLEDVISGKYTTFDGKELGVAGLWKIKQDCLAMLSVHESFKSRGLEASFADKDFMEGPFLKSYSTENQIRGVLLGLIVAHGQSQPEMVIRYIEWISQRTKDPSVVIGFASTLVSSVSTPKHPVWIEYVLTTGWKSFEEKAAVLKIGDAASLNEAYNEVEMLLRFVKGSDDAVATLTDRILHLCVRYPILEEGLMNCFILVFNEKVDIVLSQMVKSGNLHWLENYLEYLPDQRREGVRAKLKERYGKLFR